MADSFPDASSKLGPQTKKSLFERQKAEAEARKAREKAETAAVYEDFVKSFDEDGNTTPPVRQPIGRQPGTGGSNHGSAPGKRHFTTSGLKSGPGSLGPSPGLPKSGPGSLGPVPSSQSGRKRHYDDFQGSRREWEHGMFAYEDDRRTPRPEEARERFDEEETRDDNESKAAPKPTLHLSNLPPGTSTAVIRALLTPSPLVVDDVRILPPPAPSATSTTERKSTSAIVTLAAETPATDIDTVVSHLQNKYLGFGYNLSISRHLSSAALGGPNVVTAPSTSVNNLPFGAKPVLQHSSLSRAPPPGQSRFAPPPSYTSSTPYGRGATVPHTRVVVQPPSDLKQLRLIHKTLEALLTYGPEFEALLMSRPHVQQEEKWAWLWDSRSAAGVYYRWRLWDILTNGGGRRRQRSAYAPYSRSEVLFEGSSSWQPPEVGLKFEFTTRMDEFISDDDYDSSDEEGEHEGGLARRYNDHNMTGAGPTDPSDANEGVGYLNPLAKTKFIHLLSRLPESNAKLRRGDVARITGFAIEHAGAGADEVAQLLARNVVEPFCFLQQSDRNEADGDDDEESREDRLREGKSDRQDTSTASLVGLYVISDILSSSASAGVRHAWRYRSLIESALRQQKVFERLGRLDRDLGWGKLKAEKWKRSIQGVLSLWEGWCVFPQSSQEEFVDRSLNPPLTEREKRLAQAEAERKEADLQRMKANTKWRSVKDDEGMAPSDDVNMDDVDRLAMADDGLDGRAMVEEDLIDEDLDGVPMMDSSDEGADEEGDEEATKESAAVPESDSVQEASRTGPGPARRQRMRAVDMFADDSDG